MRFKDIVPGMTIRCQSVGERLFLLEQLEKLGYVWGHDGMKPTESLPANPKALYIMTEKENKLSYSCFAANSVDYSDFCIGIDVEIAYKRGLDDAWDLIKKLCLSEKDGGLDRDIYIECFGTGTSLGNILKNYNCKDVIDMIKEQKERLRIGDIVDINGKKAFVAFVDTEKVCVVYTDGTCRDYQIDNQSIVKTGENISISRILSKYLEMENENN